jgi:CRP/FNR family transcriptional regulator
VILWFCFPGEVFGLAEASRGGPRDVYAQVCSDAVVHRIPRQQFSQFVEARPRVALQVIDLLSCRLRVLGDILTNLATDDATSRIIKLLLRLCSRYGQMNTGCSVLGGGDGAICLDIPLTHQEMADMLGTSRQTVSTVIGELKKAGALKTTHRHMHVEPARLETLLLETMPE